MAKKSNSLAKLIKQDLKGWEEEKKRLPKIIGEEASNFFTENFRKQGFDDSGVKSWKQRKSKSKGNSTTKSQKNSRGILIGKGSGNKLSRSLRVLSANQKKIIVGSTVGYSGVHNFGLRAGRGAGFKMPTRKFIGNSKKLSKNITKLIAKRIERRFKR